MAHALISLLAFLQRWRWRPAAVRPANRQSLDPIRGDNPPAGLPRHPAARLYTRRGHPRARVSMIQCAVEEEDRASSPDPRFPGDAIPAFPTAASEFVREAPRAASSSPRKDW